MHLHIEVTAEGVETDEQFDVLAAMGCNTYQGFLLSQPLTTGDMEARLTANSPPPIQRVAQPAASSTAARRVSRWRIPSRASWA